MLLNNFSEFKYEAGIDEAGRGSLAGPVTAAAVIFDKDFNHDELNDSKKISLKKKSRTKESNSGKFFSLFCSICQSKRNR